MKTELKNKDRNFLADLHLGEILRFLPEYTIEFIRNRFDRFDQTYNVDTSKPVSKSELGVAGQLLEAAELYWPTSPRNFQRMMQAIPTKFDGYDFIDMGCGKGRGLLLAMEHPFSRIIGIEFSPMLADIAAKNVKRFSERFGGGR